MVNNNNRGVSDSGALEEHVSKCCLADILDENEHLLVLHLFSLIGRKSPESKYIGLAKCNDLLCPDYYSWGKNHYCANPDVIERYMLNHQEDLPDAN